jgi:hypothetical protein
LNDDGFNVADNEDKGRNVFLNDGVSQHGLDWNDATFTDDALWDNLYNLELGEWRSKKDWKMAAGCMDTTQRRVLLKSIATISRIFARLSQRPGTDWPEQEWVLLQLTDINGGGDKDPKNRRSKTSVNAYGRKEGIAKYNKWRTDTKEGGDQFVNQSTSSVKVLESLWKCKEENEAVVVPPTSKSGEDLKGSALGLVSTVNSGVEPVSTVDLGVHNHVEEDEAAAVPTTFESGVEDEEHVTITPSVNHTALAHYIKKYPHIYTKELLERIDNIVSRNSVYDSAGTTKPSSAQAPIRNVNDDYVGQLRAIERAAAIVTKNSDYDSVGTTEPSSPPAPIRNDNVSDDDSVGQLCAIERATAIVTKNSITI